MDNSQRTQNLSPEAIRGQVARITASEEFYRSRFLCAFLEFSVEQTLLSNHGALKEYWVGKIIFVREGRYNPATDPIVRVQARRLRQKLDRYYQTAGERDGVRIEVPRGGYSAIFSARPS